MTLRVTHAKVTSGAEDNDVEVDLGDWNDDHTIDVSNPTFSGTLTAPIVSTTDHYEENATTDHAYRLRARTNVALGYAVPTFQSLKTNSPTALDIWPSGAAPAESSGNGFTWVDACDADLSLNELAPVRCARIAMTSTAAQFGMVNFNGATTLPIEFIVGSGGGTAVKGSISAAGLYKIGLGADATVFGTHLLVSPTSANPSAAVRDNVNHSEWFAAASSVVVTGSATNHALHIRTNNVTALIVGTDLSLLGANAIRSSHATAGVGYATGAGGTVTQGTSRTTGVTLDKVCGAITLFSAAGSATPASFTVTNSTVAATDVVHVSQKSGTDLYNIHVTAVGAGSFKITFYTTGGTTVEQPVFNFAVIKAVAA